MQSTQQQEFWRTRNSSWYLQTLWKSLIWGWIRIEPKSLAATPSDKSYAILTASREIHPFLLTVKAGKANQNLKLLQTFLILSHLTPNTEGVKKKGRIKEFSSRFLPYKKAKTKRRKAKTKIYAVFPQYSLEISSRTFNDTKIRKSFIYYGEV